MKHQVCKYEELELERKKAVVVNGKAIVLVKSKNGEVFALRDVCPHKGPCLSLGMIDENCSSSSVGEYIFEKDKEVLRCPWHSWEFDIRTGRSIFNPDKVRVKTYEVNIDNGLVYIEV